MVKLQENGAISAWTTDHLTRYRWRVRSDHDIHRQRLGSKSSEKTGRSTSGGMRLHNGGLLRFWSSRQKVVSLSSWESELCAVVSLGQKLSDSKAGSENSGTSRV